MKIKLIIRESSPEFNSIEKVFNTLLPYLEVEKKVLPFSCHGLWNKVFNFISLHKFRNDIIHLSGHEHYLFALPLFRKSILTIHDIEGVYRLKGWRKWIFKKLWYDLPIRNSEVITTISEFSKKEIESLGNYKKIIKVIPNPLTLPLTYEPKVFNVQEPRILHIGTKPNKNVSRLLDAVMGINCSLVVIGKLSEELIIKAKENQVNLKIRNNLSNVEVMDEYREADILSFVSTYEGFGLPIIEAQAVGRVVLTANITSMPEVAGDGALLVDPYSVQDIHKGIVRLIEEEHYRDQLIKNGLNNIKRFNVRDVAEKYKEIYKELTV
ncbi:MAG: glycosyltransferase family 4 protein [Flavobacteriales bacterium]|nr:glycosyltransferase family 4 protein [Flavobacteriales bacterium]